METKGQSSRGLNQYVFLFLSMWFSVSFTKYASGITENHAIYIWRRFVILLPHLLEHQIHCRLFFRCTSSPAKHDTFYPPGNRKGQTKEQKKRYTVKHYTAMFFYSLAPGHLISSALKVISFKHGGPLQIFSVYGAPLSRITFHYIFSLAPLLIVFVLIFSNPQVHA